MNLLGGGDGFGDGDGSPLAPACDPLTSTDRTALMYARHSTVWFQGIIDRRDDAAVLRASRPRAFGYGPREPWDKAWHGIRDLVAALGADGASVPWVAGEADTNCGRAGRLTERRTTAFRCFGLAAQVLPARAFGNATGRPLMAGRYGAGQGGVSFALPTVMARELAARASVTIAFPDSGMELPVGTLMDVPLLRPDGIASTQEAIAALAEGAGGVPVSSGGLQGFFVPFAVPVYLAGGSVEGFECVVDLEAPITLAGWSAALGEALGADGGARASAFAVPVRLWVFGEQMELPSLGDLKTTAKSSAAAAQALAAAAATAPSSVPFGSAVTATDAGEVVVADAEGAWNQRPAAPSANLLLVRQARAELATWIAESSRVMERLARATAAAVAEMGDGKPTPALAAALQDVEQLAARTTAEADAWPPAASGAGSKEGRKP